MNKKQAFTNLIFLFILFLCFSLTSCKKIESYGDMDSIIHQNILTKEGKYLVFIYGDNCSFCEKLEPTIFEYATLAKKKKVLPIYALNASNTKLNPELVKNTDDYDDFKGTTNYRDIHIATTPALIVIEDGCVERYISSKTTIQPMSEIKSYINRLMNQES